MGHAAACGAWRAARPSPSSSAPGPPPLIVVAEAAPRRKVAPVRRSVPPWHSHGGWQCHHRLQAGSGLGAAAAAAASLQQHYPPPRRRGRRRPEDEDEEWCGWPGPAALRREAVDDCSSSCRRFAGPSAEEARIRSSCYDIWAPRGRPGAQNRCCAWLAQELLSVPRTATAHSATRCRAWRCR